MDKERKEKTARVQDAEADGIIEGRNAVIEALRAGTTCLLYTSPSPRDTR